MEKRMMKLLENVDSICDECKLYAHCKGLQTGDLIRLNKRVYEEGDVQLICPIGYIIHLGMLNSVYNDDTIIQELPEKGSVVKR